MNGSTQVLVADAPDEPEALGSALDVLRDEERERMARFRSPTDAASFAGGRALVRLELARLLGVSPQELVFDTWCARCGSTHGKPRLVEPAAEVEFNLSHAGSTLVLAVARAPVGVDVERLDRDAEPDVTRLACAEDERAELAGLPPADRPRGFLACWTRKEALLKALGHGLAVDPKSVSVTFLDGVEPRVRRLPAEFGPAEAWSLVPLRGEGWLGAVVVRGGASLEVRAAQDLLRSA